MPHIIPLKIEKSSCCVYYAAGSKSFFTTAEIKIARAAALAEAELSIGVLCRRIIPVPCGEMGKRSLLGRSRHRKHEHHEREVLMHLVFMPQKPFVRSRVP